TRRHSSVNNQSLSALNPGVNVFSPMGFSFGKDERLNKRKHIQELFERGSSFYSYPFRIFFLPLPAAEVHQVLISVSTRNFKRAVDRNLIKRRMREAYRLQKHKLPEARLAMAFIYSAKEILTFAEIEQKMLLAFGKVHKMAKYSNDSIGNPK
ncbi:MAG TPA: ribonuclease P protein component, partial [Cyclobacteriaceae bacterium]|nr:ribonuclease P protein component [Cyclobacteriaceae bacterium]